MIDVSLPHSSIILHDYVGEGSADAGNDSWLSVSVLAVFSHDRLSNLELAEACLLIMVCLLCGLLQLNISLYVRA